MDNRDWDNWTCSNFSADGPSFPPTQIGESTVKFGGVGVYATERIPPRTKVCTYSGVEVHPKSARVHRIRKTHGHIKTFWVHDNGRAVNGEPTGFVTHRRMAQFAMHASLVNTHPALEPQENNCYWEREEGHYYQLHPGSKSMDVRYFVTTNRWVEAGEELFVWLGDDIAAHIEEERRTWPEYNAYLEVYDEWRKADKAWRRQQAGLSPPRRVTFADSGGGSV